MVEQSHYGPGPLFADMGLLGALCAPTPRLVSEFESAHSWCSYERDGRGHLVVGGAKPLWSRPARIADRRGARGIMPLRPMWSANSLPSPRKEIYLIANPMAKPNVQSDTACKAVPFRYRPLRMNALAAWRLPRNLRREPSSSSGAALCCARQ